MTTYLFLYKGYVQPTPEIGQAWMGWFDSVAHTMVDSGHPMTRGVEVTPDGVHELPSALTRSPGTRSSRPTSHEAAVALAHTNPMVTSVVVHELAKM